jgi:hypothetical protein
MMANGAAARYIMAELSAWAGPSPNCEAVLVQIEHCAYNNCAPKAGNKKQMRNINLFVFISWQK